LLWASFENNRRKTKFWAIFFLGKRCALISSCTKFWANISQTHLVTLAHNYKLQECYCPQGTSPEAKLVGS
jgi:hypothetical protein